MIGNNITQWGAISRLERGYDVFATSAFAAQYACRMASTNNNRGKALSYHYNPGEGFYPYYHPLGRRWYRNSKYAPHCWFPYF